MKELSIEEKAKAYDEAIERARVWKDKSGMPKDKQGILDDIFPELKESEDEKIRKEILEYFVGKGSLMLPTKVVLDKWIAWLEKQGEPKEYTFKSLPRLLDMIEPSDRAKAYCQKLIDTLAKEEYNTDAKIVDEVLKGWNGEDVPMAVMDEQKPVDKAEPKFKVKYAGSEYNVLEIKDIAGDAYYGIEDEPNHIDYVLPDNCEIVSERKSSWSEEDDDDAWMNDIISKVENNLQLNKAEIDWLKSLRPQLKQKWSEEDEDMRYKAKAVINRLCAEGKEYVWSIETLKKIFNWLNFLKDRVQPQPKQEWSEEDINMINWLIRCCKEEHKELCNDKYGHQDIVSDLKRDCRKKWDWLESLKNRVGLQDHWKPSDEQLEALKNAIHIRPFKNPSDSILWGLYEQLNKLKG